MGNFCGSTGSVELVWRTISRTKQWGEIKQIVLLKLNSRREKKSTKQTTLKNRKTLKNGGNILRRIWLHSRERNIKTVWQSEAQVHSLFRRRQTICSSAKNWTICNLQCKWTWKEARKWNLVNSFSLSVKDNQKKNCKAESQIAIEITYKKIYR